MSQYVINIGAIPNDGTGDPLRTAFNEVNLNFDQVFAAGPVGSNIQIVNNTILTTNTNGNLILNPNGIGNVVANSHVVPDQTRVRNLGSPLRRWNTIYGQYMDVANAAFSGNVYIGGNLSVVGNTVTYGYSNLAISNINITLAQGANTPTLANNGGIILAGANASILYNSALNAWVANIPVRVSGAVTATQFIGDGSQLTNVVAIANAQTLTGTFINSTVTNSALTTVGTLSNLSVSGTIVGNAISGTMSGDGGNLANITGANVTGNVTTSYFANVANLAILSTVATFANTANAANSAIYSVFAQQANTAFVANTVSTNAQPNITTVGTLTYVAVSGNVDTANINVAGNVRAGNIYTNNYYFANGVPIIDFISAPGGSNTEVQFNNSGSFGASAAFTFDRSSNALTVSGNISANYFVGNGSQLTGISAGTPYANTVGSFGSDMGTGPNYALNDPAVLFGDDDVIIRTGGTTSNYGQMDLAASEQLYIGLAANLANATYVPSYTSSIHFEYGGNTINAIAGTNYLTIDANTGLTYNGNPIGGGNYGNSNVAAYLPTYTGDLGANTITANTLYSPNYYANAITYANATGYLVNTNLFKYDPATGVVTAGGANLSGNITANAITLKNTDDFAQLVFSNDGGATNNGQIKVDGGNNMIIGAASNFYVKQAGADRIAVTDTTSDFMAATNVRIQSNKTGTANTWIFDTNGNLQLPDAGLVWNNSGLTTLQAGNNGAQIGSNDGQSYVIANVDGTYMQTLADTNNYLWHFDTSGNLNLPQGGWIGAAGVKGDGTMLTGGTGQIASLTSFYADAPGIYAGCLTANPDGNVNISTYGNGTGLIGSWAFDTAGNLTVPGNIIMTTGIVGSGASPAPYLSGFDSVSAVTLSASGNVTGAYILGNGSELTNLPAPTVTQDITSNGAMSIMTYDGNIKYVNYATVEPATGNIAGGNISATGNIAGGNISVTGSVYASNLVAEAAFEIQVYDFAANIGGRYGVDTQTNTVTATLPASPPVGGAVFFADAAGAYNILNLIIDPNGQTIMGTPGNMTVSTPNQSVGLFWNGTTWRIYNAG
jgi:hypothetical protein